MDKPGKVAEVKNWLRRNHRKSSAAVLVLALSGCGGSGSKPKQTFSAQNPETTAATAINSKAESVPFVFDDLDPNADAPIPTYRGYGDAPADHITVHTFKTGNVVEATCKATGRDVPSHPENGDAKRDSNEWVGVRYLGDTSYATLTYGNIDPAALGKLPNC